MRLFISMVCLYTGALVLSNLLNVSRILVFEPSVLSYSFTIMAPIGLICYPITYFCTDVVCEIYGKKIAGHLIWTGFWVNIFMCAVLAISGLLPFQIGAHPDAFATIYGLTLNCALSSSIAYLISQNLDVFIFHKLKAMTRGKHLWLRNNASTLISQLVDTIVVVCLVKMLTGAYPEIPGQSTSHTLLQIIFSMYSFKCLIALIDTIPLYLIVNWAKQKSHLNVPTLSNS